MAISTLIPSRPIFCPTSRKIFYQKPNFGGRTYSNSEMLTDNPKGQQSSERRKGWDGMSQHGRGLPRVWAGGLVGPVGRVLR